MSAIVAARQPGAAGAAPRFRARLRATLVIALALLSIVPVAIALYVAVTRASAQAQQQVFNQLESVAETKEEAVTERLAHSQEVLRLVYGDTQDRASAVSLLTASEPDEALSGAVSNHLDTMLAGQTAFDEFFLYDLEGNVVASSNPVQVGKVVTREPFFGPSLVGEYVQPPFYAVGRTSLSMVVSLPVLGPTVNDSRQIVGVLAGRLSLDNLGALMTQRAGLGDTGETYLVSVENNYLVTPSRSEGYVLTHSYHSEGIDNALAGQDGAGVYTDYRDPSQQVIGVYRWLPKLQVALLAEMSTAEALAASRQAIRVSIAVAAVAAVLAAGVGYVVAVRITRPISQLTDIARQLASGNLGARAEVGLRNEIGELAFTFNTMADQLQSTLEKLEASVKEARLATAMAREANRLKSEFLSTMSHELRTPLNAIIGFTEILLAGMVGPLDEKHEHKIARIHLNSKRLLGLINDLLDLAKIEAGRVEVLREPFSPAQLARSLEAQMESLAQQRGLSFQVHVDPSLPATLVGDAPRIEQAVGNLLSNAFKFTNKGRVALGLNGNGRDSWSVSVTDTGIGIPPHALEYIFDEFRQVDSGSQRAYGGSGLGLSITRNLARIMGGEVRVASTLGEGSTFTVTLPLVVPEGMKAEAAL